MPQHHEERNHQPVTRSARHAFLDALQAVVGHDNLAAALRLIDERVDAATREAGTPCCPKDDHWREADTGELRVGHGDDVGECELGCPVDDLDRAGLIAVPVFARCPKGHDWYGPCPVCAGTQDEDAP